MELWVLSVTSAAEQRQNQTAVMDALKMFDKTVRKPLGEKYMGAGSVEDLTTDPDSSKQQSKISTAADVNGLPELPPKAKDADKTQDFSDKPKPVSTSGRCTFMCCRCNVE